MGIYLTPGHVYSDGEFVNGPSLTEHVGEAVIKPTFYSSQTAKDPVVLTDELLVRDTVADAYRRVSLATLQGLMVGPGGVIQTSYAEYTASSNLSTVIPNDDTIPQNTEGTEILTATITPAFSTSKILATFDGVFCNTTGPSHCCAALFRDAAASALAASPFVYASATSNYNTLMSLRYLDSPSTTSAITYRIRVGPNTSGPMRMNGAVSGRSMGGVMRTTLVLQEIKQ